MIVSMKCIFGCGRVPHNVEASLQKGMRMKVPFDGRSSLLIRRKGEEGSV